MDLSRFDAAPLIAFTATKEINYGTETDGRISARCGAYRADDFPCIAPDQFRFDGFKERLNSRIVIAISLSTHGVRRHIKLDVRAGRHIKLDVRAA